MLKKPLLKIFALIALPISLSAQAMRFELPAPLANYDEFARVYASGDIADDSGKVFDQFAERHQLKKALVILDSRGGSLFGGLDLGRAIRKRGFDTTIGKFKNGLLVAEGDCASACAYAFAGGINRYYRAGKTRLGLHQFNKPGNAMSNEERLAQTAPLTAYLQSMGVNPAALSLSTIADPDSMLWLSTSDALRLDLSNKLLAPGLSSPRSQARQTNH